MNNNINSNHITSGSSPPAVHNPSNNGSNATTDVYQHFLHLHRAQLINIGIPELYWPALHKKLLHDTVDAGEHFTMTVDGENWEVYAHKLEVSEPKSVFLIDHAWTYQIPFARKQLQLFPELFTRLGKLMEIDPVYFQDEEVCQPTKVMIDKLMGAMWCYNQTYNFSHIIDDEPTWYVMDEFGSRIQHSNTPNVVVSPLFYSNRNLTYSVLWPLGDIIESPIRRDYCPSVTGIVLREIRLSPWLGVDRELLMEKLDVMLKYEQPQMKPLNIENLQKSTAPIDCKATYKCSYTVFSGLELVKTALTREEFRIVPDMKSADIIWISESYRDFEKLTSGSDSQPLFVNQFPYESLLTCKHFMAIMIQNNYPFDAEDFEIRGPKWLPLTFHLTSELTLFVRCYLKRESLGLPNYWILKPVNKGRGIDCHVTYNLDKIIRLNESYEKVACRYITNPVLFDRPDIGQVKFDIRYVILLDSVDPLEVYAHKMFWLRFANQPFSLTDLDNYEKHFTVMNYRPEAELKTILSDEFTNLFEEQYQNIKWSEIQKDIFSLLKETFQIFTKSPPPGGIAKCEKSKALYAADLMLEWCTHHDESGNVIIKPEPRLLEVNFSPDTVRAVTYDPNFYNDVFGFLFLKERQGTPFIKL